MLVSRTASNQTNMPGTIGPQLIEDLAARMYADSIVVQLVKWTITTLVLLKHSHNASCDKALLVIKQIVWSLTCNQEHLQP